MKEGDDELTLFWRAVRDSAEVYCEFLERLQRGERFGQSQPHTGHLYQVKDRTWRRERKLDKQMQSGLLNNVDLPQRVHWFKRD